MLSPLSPGEVRVQDEDGKEVSFYITGGLLEVQPHSVTILADTALRGDQLDEAAALAAQKDAEEALRGASAHTDVARAQAELEEARARYRAAQLSPKLSNTCSCRRGDFDPKNTRPLGGMVGSLVRPTGRQSRSRPSKNDPFW